MKILSFLPFFMADDIQLSQCLSSSYFLILILIWIMMMNIIMMSSDFEKCCHVSLSRWWRNLILQIRQNAHRGFLSLLIWANRPIKEQLKRYIWVFVQKNNNRSEIMFQLFISYKAWVYLNLPAIPLLYHDFFIQNLISAILFYSKKEN